ncbi:MAG: GNAT family N-acetyltransferase [Phycisphaerales bacterium]|nr:MAG: GNAT family N-acetyltransferase [Phycisphaerales bacterium]
MSDRPIRIRRGSMADLDTIVQFNRAMAVESENKTLDPSTVTDGVRRALEDPGRSVYFLAEADRTVVGQAMVTMEWSDWRNGFFWWIQSVYVDPGSRNRGVFRAIYEHIHALASKRPDVCGVRLYVHRDNRTAIEVYGKLGMKLTDYLLYEEDLSEVSDSPAS